MKRLRAFIGLAVLVVLLSCGQRRNEVINGHWHSLTPTLGTYKTLDINDSVAIADKYEIGGLRPRVTLRKDISAGELVLPDQDLKYTSKYGLKGDTLVIGDNQSAYKYIRSDIDNCELKDRYAGSAIKISPAESTTGEGYDDLFWKLFCSDIFVGKLESNKDSVFIEADDVFVSLTELPQYCNKIKDFWPPDDTVNIVIHADKAVSKLFIKRMLEKIPKSIRIYKAVKNKGERLSVEKLMRD